MPHYRPYLVVKRATTPEKPLSNLPTVGINALVLAVQIPMTKTPAEETSLPDRQNNMRT